MSKSYRDATIKYQRENNLLRGDRTSQAEKMMDTWQKPSSSMIGERNSPI